eukprot:2664416-Rhodomonas_salina.6
MDALKEHLEKAGVVALLDEVADLGAACLEDLKWLEVTDLDQLLDPDTQNKFAHVLEEVKLRFPGRASTGSGVHANSHVEPVILLQLAKAGDVVGLRKTLQQGFVNVDAEEEGSGVTALCVAADGGKRALSKTLISRGANVNHA